MNDLRVIVGPRISYRPVWSRREHRTIWITCAPTALRSEYEAPTCCTGRGGRRGRAARRKAERAWAAQWMRMCAVKDPDEVPF